MNVNEITKHIMMINNTDDLNHIKRMLTMRREDLTRDLKDTLKPGDRVKVDSKRITEGTVHKVNRTCAVILDNKGTGWDIPFKMITKGE